MALTLDLPLSVKRIILAVAVFFAGFALGAWVARWLYAY